MNKYMAKCLLAINEAKKELESYSNQWSDVIGHKFLFNSLDEIADIVSVIKGKEEELAMIVNEILGSVPVDELNSLVRSISGYEE